MNEDLYQNERLYQFLKIHLPSNVGSLLYKCSTTIESVRKQILIQQRMIQSFSLLTIAHYPKKHVPEQSKLVEFIFNQFQNSISSNELSAEFTQDASIFIPHIYDNLGSFARSIIQCSKSQYFDFVVNSSIPAVFGNFSSDEYTKLASVFYTHIVGRAPPELAIQILTPFFQSLPTFRFIECVMTPFSIHYGSEIRLRKIAESLNSNTEYKSTHSISMQLLEYIKSSLSLIPSTHVVLLNLMKSSRWSQGHLNYFFFHQFFIHEAKRWIESSPYAGNSDFFKQICKDAFTLEEMNKITSNLTKVVSLYELPCLCQTASQSFLLLYLSPFDIVLLAKIFTRECKDKKLELFRQQLHLRDVDEKIHYKSLWLKVFPTSVGKSMMPSPSWTQKEYSKTDISMFMQNRRSIFPLFVRSTAATANGSAGNGGNKVGLGDKKVKFAEPSSSSQINSKLNSGKSDASSRSQISLSQSNELNSGKSDASSRSQISLGQSNELNSGESDASSRSQISLGQSNKLNSGESDASSSCDGTSGSQISVTYFDNSGSTESSSCIKLTDTNPADSSLSTGSYARLSDLSKTELSNFNSLYSAIERSKSVNNLTVYDSILATSTYTASLHDEEKEKFKLFALDKNLKGLLKDVNKFEQYFKFEVQRQIIEENLLRDSSSLYNSTFARVAIDEDYDFLTNRLKRIQIMSKIRPYLISVQKQFHQEFSQLAKMWKTFSEEAKESSALSIFKSLSEQKRILFWDCVEQLKTLVVIPLIFRLEVFNEVMEKIHFIKNKREFIFNVLVMTNNEKVITSFSLFSSCLMKCEMFKNFFPDELITMWVEFESTFLHYLSQANDQKLPLLFINIQSMLEDAISPTWHSLKIDVA